MIFALLTLVASLALATVAGWFSIVGLMAILAGQPIAALVLGATLELGKLVTTSWLYRNWDTATWKLKGPLIYFTFALMLATSMGVFGFLSKAHLEQSAPTMDNASKIERITQEIDREKLLISDNDKVIQQLDATVNSFLGKDRADRALSVRRSQSQQRKQLKEDSENTQKHIDSLNDEKFKLESDLRKLQLEVGPIRYIAELIYGSENSNSKTLESAVRIFTLIIVSTLDPLAITLLIAANSTILRLQNEKEKEKSVSKTEIWPTRESLSADKTDKTDKIFPEVGEKALSSIEKTPDEDFIRQDINGANEKEKSSMAAPLFQTSLEPILDETIEEILEEAAYTEGAGAADEKKNIVPTLGFDLVEPVQTRNLKYDKQEKKEIKIQEINEEKNLIPDDLRGISQPPLPFINQPTPSRVSIINKDTLDTPFESKEISVSKKSLITPWASQSSILREILGSSPHFTPQKLNEEKIKEQVSSQKSTTEDKKSETSRTVKPETSLDIEVEKAQMAKMVSKDITFTSGIMEKKNKYPKAMSWVNEFKRT